MQRRSLVGFGRGFVAPFGAAKQLLGLPQAWPFALVPALLFSLLETGVVVSSFRYVKPWVNDELAGGNFWQDVGARLASYFSVLLLAVLGFWLSMQLAQALSAPALERVVGIVERDLGAPPRAPLGFFAELGCGLKATLLSLAVSVPLIGVLFVVELVVAPAVVVTTPLKLLVGSLGVAWSLFDYPLTLRGVGVKRRVQFVRQHLSAVLGFGAAFSLLFWLPCFNVLMLPVGVAGATRLYWEIVRASPNPAPAPAQIG